jgi:hypothetical protein
MGIIVYSKTDVYSKNLEERKRTEFFKSKFSACSFYCREEGFAAGNSSWLTAATAQSYQKNLKETDNTNEKKKKIRKNKIKNNEIKEEKKKNIPNILLRGEILYSI